MLLETSRTVYGYNGCMSDPSSHVGYCAWNPGIESEIPLAYRELETIYNPVNVFTSIDEIAQLVAETGLDALELVSFRPHRLALHELILRITADILVLEGEAEEDLGINFRQVSRRILQHYIEPYAPKIEQSYASVCADIEQFTRSEMDAVLQRLSPPKAPLPTFWQRLLGTKPRQPVMQQTREEREFELISAYRNRSRHAQNDIEAAVFRSLYRVLGSIVRTRGFIGNDAEYLVHVCSLHAINHLASRRVGRLVAECMRAAIDGEGYKLIPDARKPVLISLKGASASGKSSLRAMMRVMMAELGIEDQGYGTISPDIWRKLLLDYKSLGESYKYAGRFTSHEVSIIDVKLDRYIRAKAEKRRSIPHLVVDRFRFDSFAEEKISRVLHKTYVRYIDTMYMYFIVTPPEATVERGWQRGLERGRFKSVEDYLGHCVEAYSGMPKLLFKWLGNEKPRYFFEFLDNSVAKGEYPLLIARGSQKHMQIFRPEGFINIERYKRTNLRAKAPEQVSAAASELVVDRNLGFLRQCIQRIQRLEFIDTDSDGIYLTIESGRFEVSDQKLLQSKLEDATLRVILNELAPELLAK